MATMPETIISVPIDDRVEREAEAVLAPLTSSEFLRRVVERIARQPTALIVSEGSEEPISALILTELLVPNEETIAAIKAVERGEVKTFNTLDELFEDLHSDADD
jgi:antitoxin component of RelBE/YafQ-DinJ toxin-antitoxin module